MDILVEKAYKVTTQVGTYVVRAYDEEGAKSRVALIDDTTVKSVRENRR